MQEEQDDFTIAIPQDFIQKPAPDHREPDPAGEMEYTQMVSRQEIAEAMREQLPEQEIQLPEEEIQLPEEEIQPPELDCPVLEKPTADNPILENPTTDNPTSENPTQLNKDISRTLAWSSP